MRKVNKKLLEKMKKLRAKGLSYKNIAKLLNVTDTTVMYHLNRKFREKFIRRMIKYNKNHKEERLKKNREWRKKHNKLYKRIVCLSLVKGYLKRKIITKNDLYKIIREVENEG